MDKNIVNGFVEGIEKEAPGVPSRRLADSYDQLRPGHRVGTIPGSELDSVPDAERLGMPRDKEIRRL